MLRRVGAAVTVLGALLLSGMAAAATYSTTIQSKSTNAQDSYLSQENQTETNGSKSELRIKDSGGSKNRHMVVDITLPSLSGKTVLQGWLKLTQSAAGNTIPIDARVYPLTESWTESVVSWRTRTTILLVQQPWTVAGGTTGPYWTGRALLTEADNGSPVSWQVGPIVNAWLLGDLPQNGFLIKSLHEGSDREVIFRSSEYTSVLTATPQLLLYYTDEPPAIRSGYAEVQPRAVRVGATNTPLSFWLDVNASGATPSGTPTGFDLITIQHGGALLVTGVDGVLIGGAPLDPAQVTWYDNGTSLTVRIPRVTGQLRMEVRTRVNVLSPATTDDLDLPFTVDDTSTPGAGVQALWSGNADGVAGNGDSWTLAVTDLPPVRVDLTPDSTAVVSRLCTKLQLYGVDAQGNRFATSADSFKVVPAAAGTIAGDGTFCGAQVGTAKVIAFFASLRDTSVITVKPALVPVVSQVVLRDARGNSVTSLSPQDTMFLDVTLSDGDGFRDITAMDFALYHKDHANDVNAPAFHASYAWDRGGSPAWSLVDPGGTTWALLPASSVVDTATNATGPQTIRLAFKPGRIARASGTGLWNASVTVFSATPPDTQTSARSGLDCAQRFTLASTDTAGGFAPARAGTSSLPLSQPSDGSLSLDVWSNADLDLMASAADFIGETSPGDTIHVGAPSRPISWAFSSSGAGAARLDTTETKLLSAVPPPTSEVPLARDLHLWMDYPAAAPSQEYRGAIRLRAAATGGGGSASGLALPLTTTVVDAGQAAESAVAEVLPHAVSVGTAAQTFTAYLLPDIQAGNTGLDRVQVHVPAGYGVPRLTAVRVAGLPAAFSDSSRLGQADASLTASVDESALIEIQFQANTPTAPDEGGSDFVVSYDNSTTSIPTQVAVQGDANGLADGDTWRVVVNPGPPASITVDPATVTCFLDSTVAFTATVEDAFGNPVTSTVAWSTQGGIGSIDGTSGLFTGTAIGEGTVFGETGGVRDTARVTVRPIRGLAVRTVTGPAAVYQGEEGVLLSVLIENLGADSVTVDSVGLSFRRTSPGDANRDFEVRATPKIPFGLRSGSSVSVSFELSVLRDATPGALVSSASASAVDAGSGVRVGDADPDDPLDFAIMTGGIVVAASQTVTTVRPGSRGTAFLVLNLSNLYPDVRTVTSLNLANATAGPGTQDQLDAEFGDLTLYKDDGDGVFNSGQDAKLLTTVALAGTVNFTPLHLELSAGGNARLFVAGDVSLVARDGDALDLAVLDSTQIELTPPSYERNAWPQHPDGRFTVDGAVAAQMAVHPVTPGNLLAGSPYGLAFDVTLPSNGYEADQLLRLAVVNRGTAVAGSDIEALNAWADDGDGVFDSTTDRPLGALYFTGDRWQRTGLSEPVPVGGLRLFVTVDLADLTPDGRTVLLGLPGGGDEGVGMQSGDSGPLDRSVENPYALPVRTSDRITIAAVGLDSTSVAPGDRGASILHLIVTNSYAEARTLTHLAITNGTIGAGTTLDLDRETQALTLREDGDEDGQLGDLTSDPALGASSFTNGRATFTGMQWIVPPGASRHLYVTADVSRTEAADGDVLSASIAGPLDVEFGEPSSIAAAWPATSNARLRVDGLVPAQISNLGAPGASFGPGEGPVLALDVVLPRNGYLDDQLRGIKLLNLGTAGTADLAEVHLWRDGGDGRFTPGGGDDIDLGSLARLGNAWQSPPLAEALVGGGARIFASVTATATPADSSTVQLAIPQGGIENASGNDGPLGASVANPQTLTISTSPVLATLETETPASTVGQEIRVRMIVRNAGTESVAGMAPSALSPGGSASAYLQSGPTPPSVDIAPSERDTFTWIYVSSTAGDLLFRGSAAGTGVTSGIQRRAIEASSNIHHVYIGVADADLVPVQSMPSEVSLGQSNVIPFSLTFTNNGGIGASDVLLRRLRIRLEDGNGAGIVPSDLLTRVVVAEGTNVYLSKTPLETSGSELDLTLASTVRVTPEQPTTLSLRVDVADTTTAPSFRFVLLDSTRITAEDATSGTPVAVALRSGAYPLRSGTARLVADATRLDVQAVSLSERRVERGAVDVPLLSVRATNPGIDGVTSDVRVTSIGIVVTDTSGAPLPNPASKVARLTVRTPLQTLAVRVIQGGDGPDFTLALAPSLSVPVNTPVDFTIAGDIADSAQVGAFSVRLQPPGTFEAHDAVTHDSVLVAYATTPVQGGPVIVETAASAVRVSSRPLLPSSSHVGERGVQALEIVLRHPGGPGTARIRIDGLTLSCRDELRRPLDVASYLDRIRLLWNGLERADVTAFPASGGTAIPFTGMLDPGDSAAVRLEVDFATTAPASFFELTVPGVGITAVDANTGLLLGLQPDPGTDIPLVSGLTRLEAPPRELVAALVSRMPAVLVGDGREVAVATIRLTNTAVAGTGSIEIDHLVLRAADRLFQTLPIGAGTTRVSAYREGVLWAESGSLSPDSLTASLVADSLLHVLPGQPIELEVRFTPAPASGVSVRVGCDEEGVGVVQPSSALLQIQVRAESGSSFPLFTESGSIGAMSLKESYSNFPNPFTPAREPTTFVYYLPKDGRITLLIYTPAGERVAALAQDEPRAAGLYQNDSWSGRNGAGAVVRNGVYVAELMARYQDGTSDRVLRKVAVVR